MILDVREMHSPHKVVLGGLWSTSERARWKSEDMEVIFFQVYLYDELTFAATEGRDSI